MPKPETDQRRRTRHDEEMSARAVVAQLLTEGRAVGDFHRVPTGVGRSPDFLLSLDGEAVALEVVRFLHPAEVQKAEGRIRMVEAALKSRLQPDASRLGLKVVLGLSFRVAPLQSYRRPQVERDADQLAREIRHVLHLLVAPDAAPITIGSEVAWVLAADVSAWPAAEPGFFIGSMAPEPAFAYPDPEDFLARTLAAKSNQHIGHASTAILVIRGMFDDAEDMRRAFEATSDMIPWWRAYLVWGGGDLRLVYEAGLREAGTL